MFHHILAASDLTDTSMPALREALELARLLGVRLTVLHVTDPVHERRIVPLGNREATLLRDLALAEHEAARHLLGKQIEDALVDLGVEPKVQVLVRPGKAADAIIASALELDADLIIVGTHARKGIAHAVVGSIAERVVREAPCPVLVARGKATATATKKG